MPRKSNDITRHSLNWDDANEDTAKLILKQGELYLDAQLKISLAADQRAMVTAGALCALASSIVIATVALATQAKIGSIFWFGFPTALMLVIAAAVCIRAARPVDFGTVGSEPRTWWNSRNAVDRLNLLGGEAEDYQYRIDRNNQTLSRNAARLNVGQVTALISPAFGLVIWALDRFSPYLISLLPI